MKIIILLFVITVSPLIAESIKFDKESEYTNSIKLGNTTIKFVKIVELLDEVECKRGKEGQEDFSQEFSAVFDGGSFFLVDKKLYFNGRVVTSFKMGETYIYKNKSLYDIKGLRMALGKRFF